MDDKLSPLFSLAGRILMSAIFLASGIHKVTDWSGTAQQMEDQGMFLVPLLLVGAIAFEVGGGLSVLLGLAARWGAIALIVFLSPTTLIFHDFWAVPEDQVQMQMINFMKNLAIMGGLCMLVAFGAGAFSLDGRRAGKRAPSGAS